LSNFANTWLKPNHSLFFVKQYWYRFRYKRYFDTIEKFPLTVKQRQSIIVNEDRNLVVAGAGTGKTSTIVGKVGFLIKSKRAKPNEILAIAYNRNAAEELRERIKEKTKAEVNVGTFHSIGKSVLYESKHPSRPHQFVDQEEKLYDFLNLILKRCLKVGDFSNLYFEYFKKHEFRNIDETKDFKTEREYANWLRSNKLITLNNERVKSHGELLIANFLFSNGIAYKYEGFYSPENKMPLEATYRPDFYLPDFKVYIEYFGIDENGNTAEYIPRDKYHAEMKWKFETHRMGNTKLIDLYFHQKRQGKLLDELTKKLKEHEVKFSPIPQGELFKVINDTEKDVRFLKLVQRFLSQYKERQNTISLLSLSEKFKEDERTTLFLKLFKILLNAYQHELHQSKTIDFGDMISQSAKLVSQKKELSDYKYIIIDEFQDISDGRYDLILQFLNQNESTKLFCVGDDWQAIYRFAGSDHQIMTNFQNLFGKATTLKLDQTFRYNDQIAKVSEKFITQNPSQIKKDLKTLTNKPDPQIFIHWHHDDPLEAIRIAIKTINDQHLIKDETLLILSRYNHNKLTEGDLKTIKEQWNGGTISQRSVHSSKGLEADFVIVSDLKSDFFGFPSEIQDDPILNLVLSEEDYFLDSEERRLFYVALTRAKHQTHLIADATCPSRFAAELTNGKYPVSVTGNPNSSKKCPACSDGVLLKKTGMFGEYYSCYNFPVCTFKPLECPSCQSDIVLRENVGTDEEVAICQSEDCRTVQEHCNLCEVGIFKEFQGKRGAFLGCHDFARTKCKGTKEIPIIKKKSKFQQWVDHFENHISNLVFSDKYEFSHTFEVDEKDKKLVVVINFVKDKETHEFMSIHIDLKKFKMQIPDSISSSKDNIIFEDDRMAFAFLDSEISQRRILFAIPDTPVN